MKILKKLLVAVFALYANECSATPYTSETSPINVVEAAVESMIDNDPGLGDIERFYSQIKSDGAVRAWMNEHFSEVCQRIDALSKFPEGIRTPSATTPEIQLNGFIPPPFFIDSIPGVIYDPMVKKFQYATEHAENLLEIKNVKNQIYALLEENGLRYNAKSNGAGEKQLATLESQYGFSKNNLLVVERLLSQCIYTVTEQIASLTPLATEYGLDRKALASEKGKAIRVQRITRALLTRIAAERALTLEIDFWKRSKNALSKTVAKLHSARSKAETMRALFTSEEAEIAKGIISRQISLQQRSQWLQNHGQILIRNFDMLIDESRLIQD